MAMTIHCDIVSAEEEIFSGLVEMLVATGGEKGGERLADQSTGTRDPHLETWPVCERGVAT